MARFIEGKQIRVNEGITFEQLEQSIGGKKDYRYEKKPRKKGGVVELLEATRRFQEKDWTL